MLLDTFSPLDVLPVFTEGDGVYFNGWHFTIFMDKVPWSACTAAFLEETFTFHFGSSTVFRNCIFCRHALHSREYLPFADPIWLGNLIEGFSRANRDTDHTFAALHALASGMVEVETWGLFLCCLLPWEALRSQDVLERFLKLLTWARIDYGVDAAV